MDSLSKVMKSVLLAFSEQQKIKTTENLPRESLHRLLASTWSTDTPLRSPPAATWQHMGMGLGFLTILIPPQGHQLGTSNGSPNCYCPLFLGPILLSLCSSSSRHRTGKHKPAIFRCPSSDFLLSQNQGPHQQAIGKGRQSSSSRFCGGRAIKNTPKILTLSTLLQSKEELLYLKRSHACPGYRAPGAWRRSGRGSELNAIMQSLTVHILECSNPPNSLCMGNAGQQRLHLPRTSNMTFTW